MKHYRSLVYLERGENNTESIGYEMKKKKKATIPKKIGWCLLPGNNIRPEIKRNNNNNNNNSNNNKSNKYPVIRCMSVRSLKVLSLAFVILTVNKNPITRVLPHLLDPTTRHYYIEQ